MFRTPDDLHAAAWAALARGVADKRHPARHPTFASLGADGPALRTVVLRGWSDGTAEIHTDSRTDKVAQLQADPRFALHVWVPRQKLQIRLWGRATLTFADERRWNAIPEDARRVYGGTPEPGTPLSAPEDHTPGATLERFAAISARATRGDVVHLGEELHRRIAIRHEGDGWHAAWVAP